MLKRILTAAVALLLFIPIMVWGGDYGRTATFALICGFCMYEMLSCCGLIKNWLISIPAVFVSVISVVGPVLAWPRIFGAATALLAVLAFSLVYFVFYGIFTHKTVDTEKLLMFFSMAVYITAGFSALAILSNGGVWAAVFVLAISWGTDTFAYFSGMLFGKRKLCPNISPKKTIAGAVGGTVCGTLLGVLVIYAVDAPMFYSCFALLLSVVSQLGDLAASVIKRRFGVKDYGKIFPGHGGVLDRFDSIIPTSIVAGFIFVGTWIITQVL